MISNFGIMQGRLTRPNQGKIQSFPKKNWAKEFSLAKKLSFKFLEWTLDYEGLKTNPLMSLKNQIKIINLSHKNRIRIFSITGDCFMQKPFWKCKNVKTRQKLIGDLIMIIKSASALKIKYLILPLVDNGSIKNSEQEKILVRELMNIRAILKEKKIQILFETDLSPKKCFNFIRKFKSSSFGINYDTGNSASLNYNPVEEFREYGNYIKNIHLKDRKKFGSTVPFGQGNTNFKLIFKLCKKINFKGNFIFQGAREKSGEEINTIKKYKKFILNQIQ